MSPPVIRISTSDLVDDTCIRLTRDQVPDIAPDAKRRDKGEYTVFDATIKGIHHRWRFRRGKLVVYLVYKPSQERPPLTGLTGKRLCQTIDKHYKMDGCAWSHGYFSE